MSSVYALRSVVGDGLALVGGIPTGQALLILARLTLDSTSRIVFEGTARVHITDLFTSRSRLVLAGRG